MLKKTLHILVLFITSNICAQEEPRFTTFNSDQAYTSITINSEKVWAGTNRNGVFYIETNKNILSKNFKPYTPVNNSSNIDITKVYVTDMASDEHDNIWISHKGMDFRGKVGGIEKISPNLTIKHFYPNSNAFGYKYQKGDGLGGRKLSSIAVDKNNRVWTTNIYHEITAKGNEFAISPGAFSYKDHNNSKFTTVGGWYNNYGKKATQPKELPYPAYTKKPKPDQTAQSRNMSAISTDNNSVWIGCWEYIPKNNTSKKIPHRILKYDLEGNFETQFTYNEMKIPLGGVVNGICSDGFKGVWVTTSWKKKGFSVYDVEKKIWYYLDPKKSFKNIIPPNAKFNDNAIWKDKIGRIFLGTDKGLIVYNGHGDITNPNSYKIYTNYDFGATSGNMLNVFDSQMTSSNISSGCSDPQNPNINWIATDKGIMRLYLPVEKGIELYHIKNHYTYKDSPINTNKNIRFITELKNEIINGPASNNVTPSIAADSSASTLFRIKTNDPAGHYKTNPLYKLFLGPGPISEIQKEEYIKQYGYFKRKELKHYNNTITSLDSLKYVEYLYYHPEYINNKDYKLNGTYAKYEFKIVDISDSTKTTEIFKHPIKITIPPILLCHGVWSDIHSMSKLDDYLKNNGFDGFTLKAWRHDSKQAENPFEADASIIPNRITKLKEKAANNLLSTGKVNVIAHSRGGLYTRAYIENISNFKEYHYKNDINSLITLNTPHSGSQAANLVMDRRIVKLSKLNSLSHFLPPPINSLASLIYKTEDKPLGELISLFGFPPQKDRKENNGAKNLLVVIDVISGIPKNEKFIEKLNHISNREKLKNIPIHAIATTFKTCDANKIYCNDITDVIGDIINPNNASDETKRRIPKAFFRIIWMYNAFTFITNDVPKTIDGFTKYLYDNEENDLIVPLKSMEAGLNKKFISNFAGENIAHVDINSEVIAPNASGVTTSLSVHNKLLRLLKENVYDKSSSSNFTKSGIQPPSLTYFFLGGWNGDIANKVDETVISKIFINKNPEIFNENIVERTKLNYKIYAENLDKIMIYYENKHSKDSLIYEVRKNISFENNISYRIPTGHSGKTIITANGYKNGKLRSIDTIHFNSKLPKGTTLKSIKFKHQNPILINKQNYSFDLIGKFSDGIDRIINNFEEITYTIENTSIISYIDNKSIKAEMKGNTLLTASINGFEDTILVTVEEDPSLYTTIITNFNGNINKTGVEITWETLREFKNKKFLLERSFQSLDNFSEINQQDGNGTLQAPSKFKYTDTNLGEHKVIFYRLKMISESGKESYSSTIKINRDVLSVKANTEAINSSLKLYPNPSKSEDVTLYLNSKFQDQDATLELYSLQGKQLSFQNLNIEKGENNIRLKISKHLNNGIYLVKISTSEFVKSIKLIVKK